MDYETQIEEAKEVIKMLQRQVKELKTEFEALQKQIIVIKAERDRVIREVNEPIYAAKAEAMKLIQEARAQAKGITESAAQQKADTDAYCLKATQETNDLLHIAKAAGEELKQGREQLVKANTGFEKVKSAAEAELKRINGGLQVQIAKSKEILNQLNNRQAELDTRESDLAKREEELQKENVKLSSVWNNLEATRQVAHELSGLLEQKKQIVEKAKEENAKVLIEISNEQAKLAASIAQNQAILDEISAKQEALNKQREDIGRKANALDKQSADQAEREKLLGEKRRLLVVIDRQTQEKIDTLEKLRAKEEA
jgi:DNA repair exonuclease SbcCD ATPase subunit